MPDRDIYNRHVPRGWQTAARFVFTGQDADVTRAKLLRALGKDVQQNGLPGIDAIASIVAAAVTASNSTIVREALFQLEQVCFRHASDRTVLAVKTARRILLNPSAELSELANLRDPSQVALRTVRLCLIDLVVKALSPPSLTAELVETRDLSFRDYRTRLSRVKSLLEDDPQLDLLASRLRSSPGGEGIKAPRIVDPKLTPEELISLPLTV